MCPIILLTGEDLGLNPSSVEQAKFEYSPLDKIFNKGLDKDEDKKEGLLKRLKNTENKIKSKNKEQSESIKDEEQLEAMKGQSTMADNKLKKIVLLKDRLGNIFDNFDSNFNNTGKKFLKNISKDEKEIDYDNLFLKINDESVVKNVDFLKEFGILYDLLIYLIGNANRIINATED